MLFNRKKGLFFHFFAISLLLLKRQTNFFWKMGELQAANEKYENTNMQYDSQASGDVE